MARNSSGHLKFTRCITLLLAMARSKRGIHIRPFAARYGWNVRAVYRDLDTLRDAGVPIENPEHGFVCVPDHWLPPAAVDTTADERMALHVARRLAPGLHATVLGRALASLWTKLATPGRQPSLALGDETWLEASSPAAIDYAPHQIVVDTVRDAIRTRSALRIRYRRPGGIESERVIEPAVVSWHPAHEALYLFAWCRTRDAVRNFAIHRIVHAERTGDTFARRSQVRDQIARAFRLWPRPHTEHIVLRFSPQVADEIRERSWHASARLTDSDDGGVVLEMDISAPQELERMLLGYGPDVEIEAPAALAERVHARHAAAVANARLGTLRARPKPPPVAASHPLAPPAAVAALTATAPPAAASTAPAPPAAVAAPSAIAPHRARSKGKRP